MTTSTDHRARTANAAADAIDNLETGAIRPALVGFDGFVDFIVRVVDRRVDMSIAGFEPIRTIDAFAKRCAAAAGKSTNLEVVDTDERWGGNGPLLAGTLASLGVPTTFIGAVARDDDKLTLDPIFAPFANRCTKVIPIAPPGRTDAFEFDDGKIMLNRTLNVQRIGWDWLIKSVGIDQLADIIRDVGLIGLVNWTLMGEVESIWRGLMDDLFPRFPDLARDTHIFFDLSDPAKRSDEDLTRALALITEMQSHASVTLGLNLAEAHRVASVLGVQCSETDLAESASQIRDKISVDCIVIHPRHGAAAADSTGADWFDGPLTSRPTISTGAGDHFSGGFMFARANALPLNQSLATGCATSGWYVRRAATPSRSDLATFLRNLPLPEGLA